MQTKFRKSPLRLRWCVIYGFQAMCSCALSLSVFINMSRPRISWFASQGYTPGILQGYLMIPFRLPCRAGSLQLFPTEHNLESCRSLFAMFPQSDRMERFHWLDKVLWVAKLTKTTGILTSVFPWQARGNSSGSSRILLYAMSTQIARAWGKYNNHSLSACDVLTSQIPSQTSTINSSS